MLKTKLVVVAIAGMLAMCVGLTACGGSSSASSASASSSSASSSVASSSADASSSAAASSEASSSADASSSAAASSEASGSAETNEIVFWKGTLSDGSTVCYVDDVQSSEAALLVAKSDFSDASLWVGPISINSDGVITITDTESKKTITYTITGITTDSFTINLDGYGEVELKAVTESDIKAYAEKLAAAAAAEGEKLLKEIEEAAQNLKQEVKTELDNLSKEIEQLQNEYNSLDEKAVLFWDGTLADGQGVVYMDDPKSGEAFLSITKPDFSDAAVWYGKFSASEDGKIVTITDNETGKTVTYEVIESTPGTVMKINVKGYGEAKLASVTKADFSQLTEELAKSADQGSDQSAAK